MGWGGRIPVLMGFQPGRGNQQLEGNRGGSTKESLRERSKVTGQEFLLFSQDFRKELALRCTEEKEEEGGGGRRKRGWGEGREGREKEWGGRYPGGTASAEGTPGGKIQACECLAHSRVLVGGDWVLSATLRSLGLFLKIVESH